MPSSARISVVLVSPEIPQNTGSIARTCAAIGARLHLVHPLGFSLDDRYLKRAGLDYWPHVDLVEHRSWEDLLGATADARRLLFSARSTRPYTQARYAPGDQLVFGCETRGLPVSLLEEHRDDTYVIPIFRPHVRSLNLSNAVAIVAYEALRQLGDLEPSPDGAEH